MTTPVKPGEGMMDAINEIAAERRRQMEAEGWSPDHDYHVHCHGELAKAAACYAAGGNLYKELWPFGTRWWKPKDRRRDLIRAAALIVAEIERLDRAAIRTKNGDDDNDR